MTSNKRIQDWLDRGRLKKQKPQVDQVSVLLARAKKDIDVAGRNLKIDVETAYVLAYNSMLKAARGFLLSKGYKTDDGGQHKTAVDFCGLFFPAANDVLIVAFDRMRRNRNLLSYDPYDFSEISQTEAESAIHNAAAFLHQVNKLIVAE